MQCINDWLDQVFKVAESNLIGRNDKAKAHVAQILIHRAATRQTPRNRNVMFTTVLGIDFFHRVLIASHDNARLFDIKQRKWQLHLIAVHQILLSCQIATDILTRHC